MPCYHPIPGWFSRTRNASGKRSIVFSLSDGYVDKPVAIPCGTCTGCRMERARQWAVRCMHEAKLWSRNVFVTLTYDDKHIPGNMSLRPLDFVQFMYRLRKWAGPGVRFFQCGEYGERTFRPHHHALFFNCDFPDKRWHKGVDNNKLYVSETLNKLWSHGFCVIGTATYASAGYIARYSLKKFIGSSVTMKEYYGERVPEYLTMSRRPGIGHDWAVKYLADWYPSDELVIEGKRSRPPRYYDSLAERRGWVGTMRLVKSKREEALESDPNSTGQRLIVREEVSKRRMEFFLSRDLEA